MVDYIDISRLRSMLLSTDPNLLSETPVLMLVGTSTRATTGEAYWRSYTSVFWYALPWASAPFTTRVTVLPSAAMTA
jgi:hypothetical protein